MKTRILKYGMLVVALLLTANCRQSDNFYTNVLRSDVFYQLYQDSKYDFLWVFDNSASMASRRQYVKDNMQTFLNILGSRKAIDYQMAMVTTDMFSHNGNLVAANGGLEVVKSASSSNPAADFASIINNVTDTPTSFWEQGLEASYQAIYTHRAKFSRTGVPLVIIYLTDEEDWSCKDNCFGVEPENNTNWVPWETSRYIDYFNTLKQNENSTVSLFPIVGLDTTGCAIASAGTRYMEVQNAVGNFGTSGSICSSMLQETYQNIARTIADRGVRFQLSSLATGTGFSVYVDHQLVPFAPENYIYEVETNSIIFTGAVPKAGAIVEVVYSQRTN